MDQVHVDRILRWGIIFSLLWLVGLGSALAVFNGVRARRLIGASNGQLAGIGRAWWCIIVGGLGLLIWLPIVGRGFLNSN
jgi:hypothetical protein